MIIGQGLNWPLNCLKLKSLRSFFVGFTSDDGFWNGLETQFQEWFDNRVDLYTDEVLTLYSDYIKTVAYDAIQELNHMGRELQHSENTKKRKLQTPEKTLLPMNRHPNALDMNFGEYKSFFIPSTPKKNKRSTDHLKNDLNSVKKILDYIEKPKKGGSRRLRRKSRKAKTRRSRMN